jgi:hypothetical protein
MLPTFMELLLYNTSVYVQKYNKGSFGKTYFTGFLIMSDNVLAFEFG